MKIENLRELFIDELKDLHSAENQIIKALPKMIKNATSAELSSAFEEHLEQTKVHVERLDQIFRVLFSVTAPARVCVKRIPICLEKLGQRLPSLVRIVFTTACKYDGPMRRVEAALGEILCLARHVLV